jgi:hypothetical protein
MSEERPTLVAEQMVQWYGVGASAVCEDRAAAAFRAGDGVAYAFWLRVSRRIHDELPVAPLVDPATAVRLAPPAE